jgi:hypothetical protein
MHLTKLLFTRASLFVLVMSFYLSAWSASLQDFQATYLIKYDGIKVGTSTLSLQSSPNSHYLLTVHNQPSLPLIKGDVTETSEGIWKEGTLPIPENYNYSYHYFTKQKHIDLQFNWPMQNLTIKINNKPWQLSIFPGTQDKLSYQLALRQDLLIGKKILSYQIADGGLIKTYQFQVVGNETITTPLGTFDTLKLIRLPIPGKEDVTLWLAKQLHYQVIRVAQQKNIIDFGTADIISYQAKEAA